MVSGYEDVLITEGFQLSFFYGLIYLLLFFLAELLGLFC